MNLTTMTFDLKDHIATITLNRPDAANALNLTMSQDLLTVASRCDSADVRAVILTAQGKMFCAGGDVLSFAAAGAGVTELMRNMTAFLHSAISRFARMNAPLITAINGTAAGAGLSMALTGDIILAAASAKFTMAYTKIGVSPDGSSTFFLPRLVGIAKAKEMILLNPVYSAEEAKTHGLVTEVLADDALMARANALAQQLAAGPTAADIRGGAIYQAPTDIAIGSYGPLQVPASVVPPQVNGSGAAPARSSLLSSSPSVCFFLSSFLSFILFSFI